ncbi:MAG: 4Fe-4S cluster-binding domain-containing protein [Caldilineaceae bacterium]
MAQVKAAQTPLGLWQYFPDSGLNVLDTDIRGEHWRPLTVSLALTGLCYKGCPFCYASSTKAGTTQWRYAELVDFITDLDRNGVFSVTLGGGEPTLWEDPQAGKNFYDLITTLDEQVALTLTFTTSGLPKLNAEQLPDRPLRLSCHYPGEARTVIARAQTLRKTLSQIGINLLLWRSQLDECRQAIVQFLAAGFPDILLLTLLPAGFGVQFAAEALSEREVAAFIQSLGIDSVRLTACQKPPQGLISTDMGCGANDWFVSITEDKIVKACSFVDSGHPLAEPTYQALLAATQNLPRLPCYRSYRTSPIAQIAPNMPI